MSSNLIVQVRSLDGKLIKVATEAYWTVGRLKEEVAKWKGHGWDKVNMHYRAKRLNDEDLLSKYDIAPDGFIMVNIRSNGGRPELIFRMGILGIVLPY